MSFDCNHRGTEMMRDLTRSIHSDGCGGRIMEEGGGSGSRTLR
jgi:hypothetical protein